MKLVKKLLISTIILFVCVSALGAAASAATPPLTLSITTVIDNISEYPGVASTNFNYTAARAYDMIISNNACYVPVAIERSFSWKHGGTTSVSFTDNYGTASCNIVMFSASSSTDAHLSLSSISYNSGGNLQSYTYTDGGRANPAITPFNWASVINDSTGTASVTLHFRYNPDIENVTTAIEVNPAYEKVIDYLGDGVPNSDTTLKGTNDYRIYLNLDTQPALASDPDKDIIFLLDISNSMEEALSGSTRIEVMKRTVNTAIDALTQNPNNRISIVTFESIVQTRVTHSSNANALRSAVGSLLTPEKEGGDVTQRGGTNYYEGLNQMSQIVRTLTDPNRETVVFFLTDGEPTAALPAINAVGYSSQVDVALSYAEYAARNFTTVDRFYSIFIGNDAGAGATLQTITQKISTSVEKYMVQVNSAAQLDSVFSRFLSQVGNSLYDVTFTDQLSQYVDYLGDVKVTRTTGGSKSYLTQGTDYAVNYNGGTKTIIVTLLGGTIASSEYAVSFNVRPNAAAQDYFEQQQSYPHTGDANTDYTGNSTSSGQPGFYSNSTAKVGYSYGINGRAEKTYAKPVVQVAALAAVNAQIQSRKTLVGKALAANMFSFVLKDSVGTEIGTATNDASGRIVFPDIPLNRQGTYTYHISEVIPASPDPRITYDDKVIVVTVTVTRDNDTLRTAVSYSTTEGFVNEFSPEPVDVVIESRKTLTGKTLEAGMFTFALKDKDRVLVQTATNDADGKIVFPAIILSEVGTYVYYITEVVPASPAPGMTYDDKEVKVTVVVTKDGTGNALRAVVNYPVDSGFANVYVPLPVKVELRVYKTLIGKELTAGMFNFHLISSLGSILQTVPNSAAGEVVFDEIEFSRVGNYTYTIREAIPMFPSPNIVYDLRTFSVTIRVVDIGGALSATVEYSNTTFENEFVFTPVTVDISLKKILEGMRLTLSMFEFELYKETGEFVEKVGNALDGTISFTGIQYTAEGTYKYTVKEIEPPDGDPRFIKHMTYDKTVFHVTVVVTKNEAAGAFEAEVTYEDDMGVEIDPIFYNSFRVRGNVW